MPLSPRIPVGKAATPSPLEIAQRQSLGLVPSVKGQGLIGIICTWQRYVICGSVKSVQIIAQTQAGSHLLLMTLRLKNRGGRSKIDQSLEGDGFVSGSQPALPSLDLQECLHP